MRPARQCAEPYRRLNLRPMPMRHGTLPQFSRGRFRPAPPPFAARSAQNALQLRVHPAPPASMPVGGAGCTPLGPFVTPLRGAACPRAHAAALGRAFPFVAVARLLRLRGRSRRREPPAPPCRSHRLEPLTPLRPPAPSGACAQAASKLRRVYIMLAFKPARAK